MIDGVNTVLLRPSHHQSGRVSSAAVANEALDSEVVTDETRLRPPLRAFDHRRGLFDISSRSGVLRSRGMIAMAAARVAPRRPFLWPEAVTGRVSDPRQRGMANSATKRAHKSSAQTTELTRVTLTTDEVRQVYGLSAAFLRRHPEIPRIKCGHRTIVFKVSDIERFLAQRAVA